MLACKKYGIRHIRAFAACSYRWIQTLAPMHQHGGLNGAFAHVRSIPNRIWYFKFLIGHVIVKLHNEFSNCFFSYDNEIHTCTTVKNISKITYSKSCILYHITYTTIEALLYQPLRFILTFKSNRSMISFWKETLQTWYAYILSCILYRHCISVFQWWHRLYCKKVFVRTLCMSQ